MAAAGTGADIRLLVSTANSSCDVKSEVSCDVEFHQEPREATRAA